MPHSSEPPKKTVTITTLSRTSSQSSTASDTDEKSPIIAASLKSPRTARFAEATAVNSPIEPPQAGGRPFTPTNHFMAQGQPADVGFGYMNKHDSVEMPDTEPNGYPSAIPKSPLKSPLKSAMKTPGAPPRELSVAVLSPQWQEEYLEKREKHTDKQQARDVKIKTRVRMAKMMMRGVNFSCSLIVLAMLASTLTIFQATVSIPARGGFTPWAPNQQIWPQVTILSIACVSLLASIIVIYAYWKGGHKRAEKAGFYYTIAAVSFFIFSTVMWGIGAGVLQGSRQNSNGKDIWSWSCTSNTRKQLFEDEVNYNLICRMQNWSLVCAIIEIVVETITITIYGIIFYRYYSKQKLRKSMATRDRARSDLYLAQLRSQSQPNTPAAFAASAAPYSAREGGWKPPVDAFEEAPAAEEGATQYVRADKKYQPAPFQLQPAPVKVPGSTPKMQQVGFTPVQTAPLQRTPSPREEALQQQQHQIPPMSAMSALSPMPSQGQETQQDHFHAAPGEEVYEFVPPPGAYDGASLDPGLYSPGGLYSPRR